MSLTDLGVQARAGHGRGADWLWRWPTRAGWARESPCRSCARWARERGWLAVTVASTGGLGTGESLQVLCVHYIVKGEWSLPWSRTDSRMKLWCGEWTVHVHLDSGQWTFHASFIWAGGGGFIFLSANGKAQGALLLFLLSLGGGKDFFFHFSLFPNVFSRCSL